MTIVGIIWALWCGVIHAEQRVETPAETGHPAVLKEAGEEEVFLSMIGHWLHRPKKGKAPYLVIMLSSLGCPGCFSFRASKQEEFIKKYGAKMEFYCVDYFLEKSDLTAMALVEALPEKQRKDARDILLTRQDKWLTSGSLTTALEKVLSPLRITITEKMRETWNELRVVELQQRQYLDTVCKIKYLPYFIVIDRKNKRVLICDTHEIATKVLDGAYARGMPLAAGS